MRRYISLVIGILLLIISPATAWQITAYDTLMDVQKDSSVIDSE